MTAFLFIGSIIWGSLAAQFLVQAISSFACGCIHLYGLLFSRVKKRLNAIFIGTALTQALLFAVLARRILVGCPFYRAPSMGRKLDRRLSRLCGHVHLLRDASA